MYTMEFCQQLSAFQGAILSADAVYQFSRLSSKAGYEDTFKCIIESISKFLYDGKYLSSQGLAKESICKVRKFALFIVLNSDLSVVSEISDMEGVEFAFNTIPTIPKCLMCELFWGLHFEKFVYETIAFTYPDLGLELASAFIDSIKYSTPSECLIKLQTICSALYKLICRLNFFNLNENMLADKLTVLFNNFQKCVSFYSNPPKSERLNAMKKDDCYKYIGNCLHSILLLVEECFEQFTHTQTLNPIDDNIYMVTYIGGYTENIEYKICDTSSQVIIDCLNKCHMSLLDRLQEVVMGVSVDIFCAWAEFDDGDKNVQRKIGELCYKVRNKLLSIPSVSEHPVVSMTQQISCKPVDLNDVIESASVENIIENINKNTEDKATWVRALIQKEYKDECIVNCIASNLNLLNEEECYQIYIKLREFVNETSEKVDYLESFEVKLFKHCNLNDKQKILEEHFENNCLVDMAESADFENMLTETFNKLIVSPDADLTDILCLFFQNPLKVFTKIFSLAAENKQQVNIMLKAMKLLESYSNHYYTSDTQPCIIKIIQTSFQSLDTEAKKSNFINFICGLKNLNTITSTKLFLLIIMPNIHKALLSKDINTLNTQCKLLQSAYTLDELIEYRAPTLAMLGQILDIVRWKITTFETISPPTLQMALDIQSTLLGSYTDIPETERRWLKSKLKNLQPLNMYYYRQLWDPPGRNYVELITGIEITRGMSTVQLATRLSQALCSCSLQEWINIWDSLTVLEDQDRLEIFYDSLFLITMLERANRTDNTWACILYCYRNFIHIIRYKFIKEPLNDVQVSVVLEKFVVLTNFALKDNTEDITTVMLPLFSYLSERRSDYSLDVMQFLKTKLKNSMFLDAFTKVFTNGAD